jgi:hypothetical protein
MTFRTTRTAGTALWVGPPPTDAVPVLRSPANDIYTARVRR